MGCGKSKHDIASGNTVIQHKKSSVNSKASQENGTETKDNNNHNKVDSLSPGGVEVEQKESESVKELGDGCKVDEGNDVELEGEAEKTNVQEVKEAEKLEVNDDDDGQKDDSLKEEDEKVNGANIAGTAEEKNTKENEKEDVRVKEEDMKDTKVSSPEVEEKRLKAEEQCEGQ